MGRRITMGLAGALALTPLAFVGTVGAQADSAVESAVPRATCGRGSEPEPGLQGQVPLADRQSGRSKQGYSCNLELIGQFQGQGTSVVNQSYRTCAYNSTAFAGRVRNPSPGVQVIDVSNPRKPKLSATLTSPAMSTDTWESLKVNEARGLLAGVSVGYGFGALAFDVYDLKADCARPKLLNSFAGTDATLPATGFNHEGQWSPDGDTYWATGIAGGNVTAIDVADPSKPRIAAVTAIGYTNHGFELSADGNRMYLTTAAPAGVVVLDVSEVQARKPVPRIRQIGRVEWGGPATIGQHTIPVTWGGKPYLVAVDEFAGEDIHIVDISDETKPKVVRQLQLEITRTENAERAGADTTGNGLFGYNGHYCSVDRRVNPTALACGYFQSGVRVFDVRDPLKPREIAYFNPPAQTGRNAALPGSWHANHPATFAHNGSDVRDAGPGVFANSGNAPDLSADWCSSPPRFVGPDQLWVACMDNGFMALRFTNQAYRKP